MDRRKCYDIKWNHSIPKNSSFKTKYNLYSKLYFHGKKIEAEKIMRIVKFCSC